jgi:hypothetical protein
MIMARHTVGSARTRLRVARESLVQLDPHLTRRAMWCRYGNNIPRRYTIASDWGHRYRTTRGATGTGR